MESGLERGHPTVTRRNFLSLPVLAVTQTNVTPTGVRVSGRLIDSATDLQEGYFALCGLGTGACSAIDAIGISVHPKNELFLRPLQSLVGQDVTVSILPRLNG